MTKKSNGEGLNHRQVTTAPLSDSKSLSNPRSTVRTDTTREENFKECTIVSSYPTPPPPRKSYFSSSSSQIKAWLSDVRFSFESYRGKREGGRRRRRESVRACVGERERERGAGGQS